MRTAVGKEAFVPLTKIRVRLQDIRLILRHGLDEPESPRESIFVSEASDGLVEVKSFNFQCQNYIFDPWEKIFVCVEFPFENMRLSYIWQFYGSGIFDPTTIASRRRLFSKCLIEVPLKPSLELIVTECLHPFYVFQICSLILWFFDNYYCKWESQQNHQLFITYTFV